MQIVALQDTPVGNGRERIFGQTDPHHIVAFHGLIGLQANLSGDAVCVGGGGYGKATPVAAVSQSMVGTDETAVLYSTAAQLGAPMRADISCSGNAIAAAVDHDGLFQDLTSDRPWPDLFGQGRRIPKAL